MGAADVSAVRRRAEREHVLPSPARDLHEGVEFGAVQIPARHEPAVEGVPVELREPVGIGRVESEALDCYEAWRWAGVALIVKTMSRGHEGSLAKGVKLKCLG